MNTAGAVGILIRVVVCTILLLMIYGSGVPRVGFIDPVRRVLCRNTGRTQVVPFFMIADAHTGCEWRLAEVHRIHDAVFSAWNR